jgi:hypothetical protein
MAGKRKRPAIGGSAAPGARQAEPSPPALWSQLASSAYGRSENDLRP